MFVVGIPDTVPFRAEPDTNSSIYVEWNQTATSIHPLLLRYELTVSGPILSSSREAGPVTTGNTTQRVLLSDVRNAVVRDLQANAQYQVLVTASSPTGRQREGREMLVSTFPNGESVDITHCNS